MLTFGPVPSRRLGRSLGINNIPPKACSYSCLYCQVGITKSHTVTPQQFFKPEEIYREVKAKVEKAYSMDDAIEYLTFVPDGEPTLDINLGRAIKKLRSLNIPIAVISNASLLWREDVRRAIGSSDWVSVKVDSIDENIWRQINRPHEVLRLHDILNGISEFAKQFGGQLVSETMLIEGVNDSQDSVEGIASFLREIGVSKAYLSIPTRPTAEVDMRVPSELAVNSAYQTLDSSLPQVEYLIGYEGDAFAFTGDVRQDLLSITAVHPMRESAVSELLVRAKSDWSLVEKLIADGSLKEVDYLGKHYYVRHFATQNKD